MKRSMALVAISLMVMMLSAPAVAQPEPGSAPAPAVDNGKRDFFLGLMREGLSLAERGYYYEASVAFNGILEKGDPVEDYYKEAEYHIAKSLYDLGLMYSAFTYFTRIADAGDTHPRYKEVFPWMLKIHNDLPGLMAAAEYMST